MISNARLGTFSGCKVHRVGGERLSVESAGATKLVPFLSQHLTRFPLAAGGIRPSLRLRGITLPPSHGRGWRLRLLRPCLLALHQAGRIPAHGSAARGAEALI